MKLDEMTAKTREAHGEFCLKFSLIIATGVFLAILVTPLTIIVGQILGHSAASDFSWTTVSAQLDTPLGYALIVWLSVAFLVAGCSQHTGQKILNARYPDKKPDKQPLFAVKRRSRKGAFSARRFEVER